MVLKLGMPELIVRAYRTQQAQAVGIIKERHQPPGQPTVPG